MSPQNSVSIQGETESRLEIKTQSSLGFLKYLSTLGKQKMAFSLMFQKKIPTVNNSCNFAKSKYINIHGRSTCSQFNVITI